VTPRDAWRTLRDTTSRHAGAVAHRVLVSSQKPWLQVRASRIAAGSPALESLGLGQLDAKRLLALRHDTELCSLLQSTSRIGVGRLLDLALEQPDLDQAVRSRLRSAEEQELSDELYRTIVLDQAGAQPRLILALSLVTFSAAKLTGMHRRAIFARCLKIALRPLDPYDGTAALTSGSARQAAAAMLAVDSSFDHDIIDALAETNARANAQALIASALKERPDEAAERFAAYTTALAPSEESLIRFAEDCDAERSSLRTAAKRRRTARQSASAAVRHLRPRGSAAYVAAVLLPPLAAVVLVIEAMARFPGR